MLGFYPISTAPISALRQGGEEVLFETRVTLPVIARGPLRAAATAYIVAASFVAQSEPPLPQNLPAVAPPAARAVNDAYRTQSTFSTPEIIPPPPIAQTMPRRAIAAARPASTAFDIEQSFVVQSEPPTQRHSLPESAEPPRRSCPKAYRAHWYGLTVPEDEPHTQGWLFPESARAPLRGADYSIHAGFVVESLLAFSGPSLPHRAFPPPRAATTAYGIAATFGVQSEPPFGRESLPVRASAPAVASWSAYWRDSQFVAQSEPPLPVALLDRSQRLPRAGRSAYDITVRTPDHEILTMARVLPERAPVLRRAAASSYDVAFRVALEEPLPGVLFLTDTARGPARSATEAYALAARWFAENIPASLGTLDVQPRPAPRSGSAAYELISRSVFAFSISGSFPGPFFADAAAVVGNSVERAALFIPGGEAGFVERIDPDDDEG